MGLRAPFGYVGYEYKMAELFCHILDSLCSHCHTNDDYQEGCKSCPAGILVFGARDYVLNAQEEDSHHAMYASDEWLERKKQAGHKGNLEVEKQRELKFVEDYKPECDVLRAMKKCIKGITPHPFFYRQYSKTGPFERPRPLVRFMKLTGAFRELELERRARWGIPILE